MTQPFCEKGPKVHEFWWVPQFSLGGIFQKIQAQSVRVRKLWLDIVVKVNIMNMHAENEVNVIRTDQSEAAILYKLSKLKQEVNSKDHIW